MADTLITGTTLIEDKRSLRGNIWSIPGSEFKTSDPDVDDIRINIATGSIVSNATDLEFIVSAILPQGVTITAVLVYGNAAAISGITWSLKRVDRLGAVTTMATAAVGTEDTSISNPIVDNSSYSYIITSGQNEFDTNDEIFGARIIFE